MDILEIVFNHLTQCIVEKNGENPIRRHVFTHPATITIPKNISLCINMSEEYIVPQDIHEKLVYAASFVYETVVPQESSLTVRLPPDTTDEAIEFLYQYLRAIKTIPVLPSGVRQVGEKYLNEMYEEVSPPENIYEPLMLYTLNLRKYVRKEEYNFFCKLLFRNQKILWSNVQKLIRCLDLFNYLGLTPFCMYAFSFLYVLTIGLSCDERKQKFGSKFFMLPIEGWDSVLVGMHPVSFIKTKDLDVYSDRYYLKMSEHLPDDPDAKYSTLVDLRIPSRSSD